MGLLDKLFRKKKEVQTASSENTLLEDIYIASDWVVNALNSSGYKADYTLESMKEIDRFFDEQNTPIGILSKNRGSIIFSISAYIGETVIKLYGGEWLTDDENPEGELYIAVKLPDGGVICPGIRCIKRCQKGSEESIYAYVCALDKNNSYTLEELVERQGL